MRLVARSVADCHQTRLYSSSRGGARRRGDHFIVLCEPETHPLALNTTGQDAGSSPPGASGRRLRGGHVATRHVESWRAFESLRRQSRGIDAPNWFRP